MANYQIGSLIKRVRKQKGITQEELAFPIIDRATLSKIENGRAVPNNKTMRALFEKLGISPDYNTNFFLDADMTDEQKILDELEEILDINHVEDDPVIMQIDILIQQLESSEEYMQNELNRQYITIAKAINAHNKKEDLKNIWAMTLEAIRISIPGFSEDLIEDYYLSRVDMLILTLMVALYNDDNDHDKAIGILYGIKRNLDKHCIDKAEMGKRYPVIIANLAYLLLYEVQRYSEAVEVCESGRKVCIETGRIFYLPVIAGYMAICLCKLGDTVKGIKLLRQAYHACDLIELYQYRDEIAEFAKNELGMGLEKV